jgi:hypothetical protein
MDQKLVSINFEAMKQKAAETAKKSAESMRARLSSAAETVSAAAKGKKDKAFAGLLDKGIELSQKQLDALQRAKKSLS